MGFCTPESRSYGPRSMCADLGCTITKNLQNQEKFDAHFTRGSRIFDDWLV